ncbi:hypothetical protein [Phytohabitans rumicis]|uniref:Uncharacterized protein n=1 Tax=Phytohabitans rumicis TaxID=1076125 RepID=A0A6V8LKV0_9ACTN|nr:hypothetical protein [Phytohabitans rumicis]GFJ93275.1 hypothetical protein Prum_069170 [Phytohabitans rumicis]
MFDWFFNLIDRRATRELLETWQPLAAASARRWQPDPAVKEAILRQILATPGDGDTAAHPDPAERAEPAPGRPKRLFAGRPSLSRRAHQGRQGS